MVRSGSFLTETTDFDLEFLKRIFSKNKKKSMPTALWRLTDIQIIEVIFVILDFFLCGVGKILPK